MNVIRVLLFILITSFSSQAQDCSKLFVDIKKGTINDLKPTATQAEVKAKFPCFTASTEDGSTINCGGGVFFTDHNFYYYTGNDFIDVRRGFTGTFSIDLFDKSENDVKTLLGKNAGGLEDGPNRYLFFDTSYGSIVLKMVRGKVDEILIYTKKPEEVELCI
ncbi:MAG TPA: hypothetical protein VLJ68_07465 [Chitinophagaceae bacterium]|nr:hypothetical protein [Chitinophagaceae bacterium]